MTTRLLLALLLFAGAALAVEPGELECHEASGGVTTRSIDFAVASRGGILFHLRYATGNSFTTQSCLANTGRHPILGNQPDEVLIHCTDPLGAVVYHRPAEQWTAIGGVLTWRETTAPHEVYVSTLECFVTGIGAAEGGR